MLALGIVAGGYLLGDGLRRARMADRAVTMRGLAERNVTADLATWTISFTAQGNELAAVQGEIERDAAHPRRFLPRRRASRPKRSPTSASRSTPFYDSNRGENNVTVSRRVQLRTNDVMRARRAYARQFDLVRSGVSIQEGSGMQYSFTRLNDVKPEMIAQATRDARESAEQFAQDSGAGVGGIRSATQGYFSIGARDGAADRGRGRRRRFAVPEGARRHHDRILPGLTLQPSALMGRGDPFQRGSGGGENGEGGGFAAGGAAGAGTSTSRSVARLSRAWRPASLSGALSTTRR